MSPKIPSRPSQQQTLRAPAPPPPLAARMRPRTLDEYIGQQHIIGPGRLLRRAIEADRLGSLLFHGPPGTGKTTLAQVIAGSTRARFVALNAVLAGVADIRLAVSEAAEHRDLRGQRTLLFVDEVHRFNKAQQDALLPWVEDGTVILIGATTENPYFEVNKALVSRSRIFQLRPLDQEALRAVVAQALADETRGFGGRDIQIDEDALAHLVNISNGDARTVLNALELAVETTPPDASGAVHLTLEVAEESIQKRAVLYDRQGDAHFDTISAFIKSIRGSDPDAALYWLARMVHAGEDPRFLLRRLIILASEDVGLADPQALGVVMACAEAFDRVGLPEGRFHLAHATLYLAATQKSNSTFALFDAIRVVSDERSGDVPNHLKDGNRDKEGFGHGEGYQYPHAFKDHWVAQQYLPENLKGRVFWQPSSQGWEGDVAPNVRRNREAQLAAMVEGVGLASIERLTSGPDDVRLDRWLQRAAGSLGGRLAVLRDAVFSAAAVQRHELVLDVDPSAGLLTWEALRRVPEGGVWSWFPPDAIQDAGMVRSLASQLPELLRPVVLECPLGALSEALGDVRVDVVVGRDVFVRSSDAAVRLRGLLAVMLPQSRLVLAESLVRFTPRLSGMLGPDSMAHAVEARWRDAEEALYTDERDPLTWWTVDRLTDLLASAGMRVTAERVTTAHNLVVNEAVVRRWFAPRPDSYGGRLVSWMTPEDVLTVRTAVDRRLRGRTIPWEGQAVVLTARRN